MRRIGLRLQVIKKQFRTSFILYRGAWLQKILRVYILFGISSKGSIEGQQHEFLQYMEGIRSIDTASQKLWCAYLTWCIDDEVYQILT